MSMIIMTSALTSILFYLSPHPLMMTLILIIQSMMVAMITGMINYNYWFSYILFMIMVGGMLVIFVYMTSVASNEKSIINNKMNIIMMSYPLVMLMSDQLLMNSFTSNTLNSINKINEFSFNKYINSPSNMLTFMIVVYLLVTLIAVVKITNIKYGPMRQK